MTAPAFMQQITELRRLTEVAIDSRLGHYSGPDAVIDVDTYYRPILELLDGFGALAAAINPCPGPHLVPVDESEIDTW